MNGPLVVLFVCIALLYVDGMPIDDASASNHHYFHENLDHFPAQLGPLFGPWIGGSQKFGYKGSVNRGHPEFLPRELLLGSGSADVGRSGPAYEELLFALNGEENPEFPSGKFSGWAFCTLDTQNPNMNKCFFLD